MSLLVSLLIVKVLHAPLPAPARPAPADSIGQEMRGGQRLVRHRVTPGETLYSLARHYKVTVDQLTATNPQLSNGLGIGQVVLVPRPAAGPARVPARAASTPLPTVPAGGAAPARYTVAKGETLFGIARRYNLAPASLIQLNHLPDNGSVRVGQELLLRAAEAGTPVVAAGPIPATRPGAPVAPAAKVDPNREAVIATVTPAAPAEKEKVVVKEKERERDDAFEAARGMTRASDLAGRKTEPGIAALIDNSGTDKYLALHKTAPVGTIMQVKNMMNGQSVYVRVIGQLPDTGENDNILVRLSPRAVAKLGTSDAKFRVETSYVP